jgi:DNA replication licensing factor MCM7
LQFVKFQELRLQELAEDVPMGHIPRCMTAVVKGELVRHVSPGDIVEISGIFLPKPYTGFKAMRAGLVANTYLEAMHIKQFKKKYSEYVITDEMRDRIEAYSAECDIYSKLARSIAPEIYGHEDVKKALLLLLVGGSGRVLPDGMKIRGDVHVCLMGDPGVAKSQLLKHITSVAPRGVYTTGKGSSGVGLTAAVVRDTVTNEFMLEGGALVLADMGICAIDEFDKMEESDRTAIHEVMEQQTVSIAKAGITTTLNARTAVLAAANPAGGRYNTAWSPQDNINLPAALLSRFDILWLILDRADVDGDTALAAHVLHVHRHLTHPVRQRLRGVCVLATDVGAWQTLDFVPLPASDLRAYVALARRVTPHFPRELTEYVASAYAELRQEEADVGDQAHSYTTARTLLSILRLAEALARLRFAPEVAQSDVDEALRLMKMSKASLADETAKTKRGPHGGDPISEIFALLRNLAEQRNVTEITYSDAVVRSF